MARFKVPAGMDGINIGGQQYNADAQGIITLPDDGDYKLPIDYERMPAAAEFADPSAEE